VITHTLTQRLSKRFTIAAVGWGIAIAFIAGTVPAAADLADLTREVKVVQTTLDKAAADAEAGRLRPLRSSLKSAQEAWSRFYVGYRGRGSGTDPAWITDIDAIQTEYMNDTNAVTPGNNAPLAAASLRHIQELLAGLLERNEVPDIGKAADALKASLAEVQTSMRALQGKAIGPDSLAELSAQWTQISEAWTSFNTALVDTNSLNLSDRELAKLKQRVDRQSALFALVGSALGNANLSSGLTSLGSAVEGLRALASQWTAQSNDEGAAVKQPPLDSGSKRRLNFR